MVRSMTAFAGSDRPIGGWVLAFEIRTINHRFIDISLRLPESFRFLETDIRALVGKHIKRGRIDCTLTFRMTEMGEAAIEINRPLVERLLAAAQEVERLAAGKLTPFNAFHVLQWPGALQPPETDHEALGREVLNLLNETLEQLVIRREAEGQQLALLIEERCHGIGNQVRATRQRLPEVLQSIRGKIINRLAEISDLPDNDRLEQEMVYLAQKLDVTEELDRLDMHLNDVLRTLGQQDPIGRRLDFLLQELNREANTLGSKSADAATTRASVDIKVLIEQMREQVQNIE